MIRFVYNLLWPIGLLLFLPGYLIKMFRRGGYREKFGQRLGLYDVDLRKRLANRRPIWLHAVSVGEVAIALKLAERLRSLQPDAYFILTTTTTTGFAFANANALPAIQAMYTPLDFWPVMRRAFAVIQPEKIVLVEAEVWPNLVAEARRRRIPIALVNARLSPRSEKRFRQFRFFVRPMFRALDLVCVQTPADVERWAALGIDRQRIVVTGNIKYDPRDGDVDLAPLSEFSRRLVLFGGSTHAGEEEILARVFLKLRAKFPTLCLFIAPRHVERVRQIRKQLEAMSLTVGLPNEESHADCILLDKTGELRRWYGIATVAFIGKSLIARGGQNPVEPIVAGAPVIFGPHMENFAAMAEALLANQGAIQVKDETELEIAAEKLLRDAEARHLLVRNAEQVLAQHRGAAERASKLVDLLASPLAIPKG